MLWCMLCLDAWGFDFFSLGCFRMQQPPYYYYTIDGSVSKSLHKSTCPASRYSVTTTFTKKWIFVTFFSCCWGPTFFTAQINAGKMAAGFCFDAHSIVVHCIPKQICDHFKVFCQEKMSNPSAVCHNCSNSLSFLTFLIRRNIPNGHQV